MLSPIALFYRILPKKFTTVNADIFSGSSFIASDNMIEEKAVHVADSLSSSWGLDKRKVELWAYSLDDKNQLDQLLEQGYDCRISKGERVVVDYRSNVVKTFKGKKLKIWESQLTTLLRKGIRLS